MSTQGFILEKTLVFFQDIIEPILEWQAGLGGLSETVYLGKGQRHRLLNRINRYAATHPNMVLQLIDKFGEECTTTLTFKAEEWMHHLSGAKLRGSPFQVLTILTPNEAAALAPRGFCNSGQYRGAGEILAFGQEGLEPKCIGYDDFIAFCTMWSTPGQVVLDLMTCYSVAGRTKSFTLTTYWEPDGHNRHKAKYSTVYLNRGYTLKDFFHELTYLLSVLARPA
jgi:hypothetical protein